MVPRTVPSPNSPHSPLTKMAATALMQTNLEVEVSDFPGVEVVDALQDLLDELSGLFLAQRLLLGQEVKQLAARDAARERESTWTS